MTKPSTFDPSAAASPDSGIYGLPYSVDEARVIVLPVPYAATTSYGGGAEDGPAALVEASRQVDLFDLDLKRPYEAGIALLHEAAHVRAWHDEARPHASVVIANAGVDDGTPAFKEALHRVNELSHRVNEDTYEHARELLSRNKLVALVGGDHATPYGAIRAHAEVHPGMGVLHIDAHADLRVAYEGFTWSHASIMHNVMERLDKVAKLVQVGIRDFSEDEYQAIKESKDRIVTHFDSNLARRRFTGETWGKQVATILEDLPAKVYVSFDIDGLDPALCPRTGTPVPGGLSFQEVVYLLHALSDSGRTIVGVDVNEVVPGESEWDANVGARVLYKLIGNMLKTQR
ncbi:MAG: agmatinase family protein [Sandaracinaceae bacterium]|nr:agmatinase family protein [Sandaracinaceae bacterium]